MDFMKKLSDNYPNSAPIHFGNWGDWFRSRSLCPARVLIYFSLFMMRKLLFCWGLHWQYQLETKWKV